MFGFDDIIGAIAGPFIGGLLGSESSNNAANAQVQAGQESNATQLAMYNQNRADMEPWRRTGENALSKLELGLGLADSKYAGDGSYGALTRPFSMNDFKADPGYGFRLSEGMKAIERSAAARGNLLSGSALKGISRYGQDSASQEFGNAYNRFNQDQANKFNRLASISGIGQTTAQQVANQGASVANSIGQTQQGIGNARASGYIGGANALAGGLGSAYNNYQSGQLMNRLFPGSGGGGYGGYGGYQNAYDNDLAQFGGG